MKFNFINYNFVIIILIFILLNNYPIRAEQISNEKIHKSLKETIPHWAINKDNTIKVMISCNFDKPCLSNIESFGGSVYEKFSDRIFFVNLPPASIEILANNPNIRYIRRALPEPLPALDTSKIKIGVSSLQNAPYQLTGSGIVTAIWEAREPETGGNLVDWNTQNDLVGRVTIRETSGSKSNHATHVAGILGGDGTNDQSLRGMATKVKLLSYNTSGFLSEYSDMINRNGLVSQNSWVFGVNSSNCGDYGDYTDLESDLDNISRGDLSKAVTIVNSAGNERNDGDCNLPNNPYNSTPEPATAKNIITVGAIYSDSNDITCFSSFGPTDDGRIKPDLVAPGDEGSCIGSVAIRSAIPNNNYDDMAGTSMAAPHVSGTTALMYQQFSCSKPHSIEVPLPSTVKALLIHTAKDINATGPDYASGWGLINATEAIDYVIYRYFREANISSVSDNDMFNFTINDSSKPVKVTLVWDDSADEPPYSLPNLVNDLDLYLKAPNGTIFKSWTLDPNNPSSPATKGGNHRDNVEQVVVDSPVKGNWEITVNATSCPECPQKYSLVYKRPFEIRLMPGSGTQAWYLISMPLIPQSNVSDMVGSLSTANNGCRVYKYDAATDDWSTFVCGQTGNSLTKLEAGYAYWVNVTKEITLEVAGDPITNNSQSSTTAIKLYGNRANFVTYPSFFEIPVNESVSGLNLKKLWKFRGQGTDAGEKRSKWDIYYDNETFEQSNFNLVPGWGIRIDTTNNATWTIPQTRSCSLLNSGQVYASSLTQDVPFVLYGTASCKEVLNKASKNVTIHLRVNGTEVTNYTMGDVDVNQYRLQVPIGAGLNVNDSVEILINNVSIGSNVTIGESGELRYLNVTANQTTDVDGDNFSSECSDCNDNNASINPNVPEICNDNIDNNCNGKIDCADSSCTTDVSCAATNITVSSLSNILSLKTYKLFEMIIKNSGQSSLNNVSWSLDLGDGTVVKSIYNVSLGSGNTTFVYMEHNYSSEGDYTITANATDVTSNVNASRGLEINSAISIKDLKQLYSNLSQKVFEFNLTNNADRNVSVNWTIDFGDGNVVNSILTSNISFGKGMLAYVQHDYSNQGDYKILVTAQDGSTIVSSKIDIEVEYLGVSNFSVLNSSGTGRTFEAYVKNYMAVNMTNVSWSLNTGNGVVSSTSPMTLQPQESAFVFVTYNYTATGSFGSNFTAVNGSWNDLEALNVTIT